MVKVMEETQKEQKKSSREARVPVRRIGTTQRSPFGFIRRLRGEMDRFFEDFGGSWLTSSNHWRELGAGWYPEIEMFERDDQIVVRADLPGLKKEDVKVEIRDDTLVLEGERRHEVEEKREGFYRSERGYGSFCRCIALPPGVKPAEAKASFKDGVLEIEIPAPERQQSTGRRIEID